MKIISIILIVLCLSFKSFATQEKVTNFHRLLVINDVGELLAVKVKNG